MKQRTITLPEIILIAGTRVALGIGVGFLVADKFRRHQRRAAGWALLGLGVATSIPLALGVVGNRNESDKRFALAS